jgi:hypothetical protein
MSPKKMGEGREYWGDDDEEKTAHRRTNDYTIYTDMHEGGRKDVEFSNAGVRCGSRYPGRCCFGAGRFLSCFGLRRGFGAENPNGHGDRRFGSLGGLVALTSAFFGLVVPKHVSREPSDWCCCKGKGE